MKRVFAIVLTLLLAVSLTACGSSGGYASDNAMTESFDAMTENKGWVEMPADGAMPEVAPQAPGQSATQSAPLANTKMIYTGELYLQTKSFDEAAQAVEQLVKDMGGYFESHNLNQGGSYRSLRATVRVPQENFDAFMDQAGEAAHVTDRYAHQEDISEQYYDVESRLTTQRTKLERLQHLLAQAENMEDIITLETAISDTELAIEQLTGSLRKYDSLVNFSTITLVLDEVYRLSSEEVPVQTFGERLAKAFTRGWERGVEGVEDFVISLARNWLSLLIFVCIAAPVAVVIRRKWRKRRTGYAPAQSDHSDNTQN